MISASFDIYTKVQTVEIVPNEIKGNSDGLSSFLEIFLYFTYRFPKDDLLLNVISYSAKLKLQNPNIQLSEVILPVGLSITRNDFKQGEWFKFILTEKAIKAIEIIEKVILHFI